NGLPAAFWVGATHDNVALPPATSVTVISNGPKVALASPSLAVIVIPEKVPTCSASGVPEICPVLSSNTAHAGRFEAVNVSVSPSGSLAAGRKVYGWPTRTAVPGGPVLLGWEFAGGG